jgi:hypothetical protein
MNSESLSQGSILISYPHLILSSSDLLKFLVGEFDHLLTPILQNLIERMEDVGSPLSDGDVLQE